MTIEKIIISCYTIDAKEAEIMLKKFLVAIMCAAILLTFVACGKDNAHQNDGTINQMESSLANDTSQPSNPTEETSKPTEVTSKPTEVTSKPTEVTSKPTEVTSKPTEVTSKPTEVTSKPTEVTSKPTEETSKPTEVTSKPTEETSKPTEETSKPTEENKSVFNTEGIISIKFYAYYGRGKGSVVPDEHLNDIIAWLDSFEIDTNRKFPELVPPGTDTIHIEIEYSDGSIVKQGKDTTVVDGVRYYIISDASPECYREIIEKTSFN